MADAGLTVPRQSGKSTFVGPSGAVRRWLGAVVVAAALWGGQAVKKTREWRVHAAVPGAAGVGLVSAGLGLRFGLWLALIAAGVFLLRLDSRL